MSSCTHPLHEHGRNPAWWMDGEPGPDLWHRWNDAKGNRFATRCPLSLPAPEEHAVGKVRPDQDDERSTRMFGD